jgi:protein-S-isoprenylcysteine O-methyltransferase Ste14
MQIEPVTLPATGWAFCLAYWLGAARRVKRPRVRRPVPQRVLAWLGMVVSSGLVVMPPAEGIPLLGRRAWPASGIAPWTGAALCLAGLAFAVWARRVLADNWSIDVEIKEGLAIITAGPYGIVRHPIYAGFGLALVGTWMTIGSLGGLCGLALVGAGIWRKTALEEDYMRRQFPAEYPAYAARVGRLLPRSGSR